MEVAVESDQFETSIHATTQEDIYVLLSDGYEVNYYQQPASDKKSARGDTELPIKKYGWVWNGME